MKDGVSVRVIGRDQQVATFRRVVPELQKSAGQANLESAEEHAAAARRFAPVLSGDLRDSIVTTRGGNQTPLFSGARVGGGGGAVFVPLHAAAVSAGNVKVRYAHIPEYGSVKMAAKPFFWPAFRFTRSRHMERARREASKALAIASK